MNYHSSENQRILGKLAEREIIMNASKLINDLLKIGKIDYDDIENYYIFVCPECGEQETDPEKQFEKIEDQYHCSYCKATFDDWDSQPQEVLEWWFVNEYLYDKLRTKDEAVIDSDYGHLWGRCGSGQAILLDNVIGEIAEDMEILDGQKYSWDEQ